MSGARFRREAAKHETTLFHDRDGYRHLRCVRPGSALYWFEIITVSGSLIFSGDGESFVFSTGTRDMFDPFRDSSCDGGINAGYWAEKLRTGNAYSYSEKMFREHVDKAVSVGEEYYPGLREDVEGVILRDSADYDLSCEASALEAVGNYRYTPPRPSGTSDWFRFANAPQWDLEDFDWWFLFALHAINWGIERYDAGKYDALGDER